MGPQLPTPSRPKVARLLVARGSLTPAKRGVPWTRLSGTILRNPSWLAIWRTAGHRGRGLRMEERSRRERDSGGSPSRSRLPRQMVAALQQVSASACLLHTLRSLTVGWHLA